VDPSYFSIPDGLKIQGPPHPLQVMGESFYPSFIVSSFWGTLTVRLVVDGIITVIIPFMVPLLFRVVLFLAPVFNSVKCVSVADDVAQVPVVPISFSAAFL
jgi:hypothetical protein